MAGSLFMLDDVPSFKEENLSQRVEAITNYLHLLREQLRYTLANIGDGNINDKDITRLIKTDGLKLVIGNDGISISLLANDTEKSVVTLTGAVTIQSMANPNEATVINGAEIDTGKINAVNITGSVIEGNEIRGGEIVGTTIEGSEIICRIGDGGTIRLQDSVGNAIGVIGVAEDDLNNYVSIATATGAIGRNNHIYLNAGSGRVYIDAEDGVFINGQQI